MTTHAHILVNTFLLTKKNEPRKYYWYAALSGLIPDFNMFIFILVEQVFKKVPSNILWTQRYFESEAWQLSFNIFNSIPLTLILFINGIYIYSKTKDTLKPHKGTMIIAAGMLIHQCSDFFLHHDDGHAHFFPLTKFIFKSPISYWDPRFYGLPISILEGLLIVLAVYLLFKRIKNKKNAYIFLAFGIIAIILKLIELYWIYKFSLIK